MSFFCSPRTVSISYFDPFDTFETVKEEFLEILPFQNVHWKAPTGAVRTVDRLPVNLVSETKAADNLKDAKLFIRLIIVTCVSVEDYRAKVRPLIRQWLPITENTTYKYDLVNDPMPIVLLYANSEVIDSNLFKSVSLIDKFTKDFPNVRTLEIKSVYKSPKEKEEFWGHLSHQLKTLVMEIFQQRLLYFQRKLDEESGFEEELCLRENILDLYLRLNMYGEATAQLHGIRSDVISNKNGELPIGSIEIPFRFLKDDTQADESIGTMFCENKLTKFKFHKYFFVRQFELLEKAAPSSLRYLRIYKLIREFLYTVQSIFNTDSNFLVFKYFLIDHALKNLPMERSLTFLEIKAELLLLKRDCWIEGVLGNTDYLLIDKTFPTSETKYAFGQLEDTYTSENTFHMNFFQFTKEILSLYNQCEGKRQRIVDILSVEIGMLHYQKKEYEKAVYLFLSCYEYYMQSKWDMIGLKILKVFVDSLTNCPHLFTLKIDEESVPVSTILSNAFLNILRISTVDEERRSWWKKFLDIQQNEPTSLVYTMDGLFQVEMNGHVCLVRPNVLSIDVTIKNDGFPEDVEADSIKLSLKNSDDSFVEFQINDVILTTSTNIYMLEATEIIYGEFMPVSLEINIGDTTFIKQFLNTNNAVELQPLYDPKNVSLIVQQANMLNLGEYALELIFVNAANLKSAEVVLAVEKDELTSTYPISFSKSEDLYEVTTDALERGKTIQYFLREQVTSFTLLTKFSYMKNDATQKFNEVRRFPIRGYLPVSVSVEDIFKRDLFIFKFLLNSSTIEEPIILYSSDLLPPIDNEQYSISRHYQPESYVYLTADPSENCLNCYQITTADKFDSSDTFQLQVTYNTLKEQLDGLVTEAVLVQGNVGWYRKFEVWKIFWEAYILPLLRYDYSAFERNWTVVLLPDTLNLTTIGSCIRKLSIDTKVSRGIINCLQRIIEGVQLSEIDVVAYTKNLIARKLIVPVELPKIEQFFYVEFFEQGNSQHQVGTPIPFKIKVENISEKWGPDASSGTFVFEITSSNEWLVHGKKRMIISSDRTELDLHIIPLKRGYLNFPRVEITNIDCDDSSRIDNPNTFETILVF